MAHHTLYRVEATGTRTKISEHRSLAEGFTAGHDAVHAHAENAHPTSSGCEAISDKLRQSPSHYYVNVHNKPYPEGAIRGQLHRK